MTYVKASAGRSKLNVIFEDVNHPRHDGNTIYLPRVRTDMSEETLSEIMASVDHEVAHDLYSDFDILREKKIDMRTKTGFIWNMVEDSRVNALEATEYPGFRELWDNTTPALMEKCRLKMLDGNPMSEALHGLIRWESAVSADLFPLCHEHSLTFKNDLKLKAVLEPFSDRLLECQKTHNKIKGSKMTYELARDLVKALGGEPEEEEKEGEEKGDKPEKDKGRKTKAESKSEKEGKEKGEKPEEEDKDEDDWCIKKVTITEADEEKLLTTHSILEIVDKRMSKVGLLYDTDMSAGGWTMTPLEKFGIVDYHNMTTTLPVLKTMLGVGSTASVFFQESYNERIRAKLITSDNFAQLVRKEIQIRARVRYQYGVKKGKLDPARLARIVLDAPGYADRVFKNKIQSITLDAAVSILIDMSGSMSGDKVLHATGAAVLLNKVFQILQVPLELAGFTDVSTYGTAVPVHYLYKPFSVLRLPEGELISFIGASSSHMTGNPDGESILFSYNNLLKRKEKKRLLIVMSDGQPAASKCMSGLSSFTKKVIQEIEGQRKVEIYGLGIESNSVEKYYKQHSVVFNAAEIPSKLLHLIEKKLLNEPGKE